MANVNQRKKNSRDRQRSKAEIPELNRKIEALERERSLLLQDSQRKNTEINLLKEEISNVKQFDFDRKARLDEAKSSVEEFEQNQKVLLSACCKTLEAFKKIKSEAYGLHTPLVASAFELKANSIESSPMALKHCENELKIKDLEVVKNNLLKLIEMLIESKEQNKLSKIQSGDHWEDKELEDVEENLKRIEMEQKRVKLELEESNEKVAEFHRKIFRTERECLHLVEEMSKLRLKCHPNLSADETEKLGWFLQKKI